MRFYRVDLQKGQTSPLYLGEYAAEKIESLAKQLGRPLRVLDIGCGSGGMMQKICSTVPKGTIGTVTGLDWSPAAVERLQGNTTYSQVLLCKSSTLPFDSLEFDIAVSIENLEHLYTDDVVPAIVEMMRVASHIVIVTPTVEEVINIPWLNSEIPLAEEDQLPIGSGEFQMLEGAVHKSTVIPASMAAAGFAIGNTTHGRYYAASADVNVAKIKVVGIMPDYSAPTLNMQYIQLLHNSKNLYQQLVNENI